MLLIRIITWDLEADAGYHECQQIQSSCYNCGFDNPIFMLGICMHSLMKDGCYDGNA